MDGFDTSTMTYMPPALPVSNVHDHALYTQPGHMPMDLQDMYTNFDMSTYAGSEDHAFNGMPSTISPSMHRMHNVFDSSNNYSADMSAAFDPQPRPEVHDGETEIDRDHKLLSFSAPSLDNLLLDFNFRPCTINTLAKLHGMFFLAESPWTNPGDSSPAPSELTCYRRNLFQITGQVLFPKSLRYFISSQGEQIPIMRCELVVCATESTEGNPVKVISVPWKSTNGQPTSEDKAEKEKEPSSVPLDPAHGQDSPENPDYTTISFGWKRLQFRMATANNGRRRELQQHFVVRLKIMATLINGNKVCISEVRSGAVIVRGRSPRNFQSRKDTPLNGGATHNRKTAASVTHTQRHNSIDSIGRPNQFGVAAQNTAPQAPPSTAPAAPVIKTEVPQAQPNTQSLFDPHDVTGAQDFYDGIMSASIHQGAMTAIPQDTFNFDQSRPYPGSSPDLARAPRPSQPSTVPISLSLMDEFPIKKPAPPARDSSTPAAKRRPSMAPPRAPSFGLTTLSSPDESADLLYEYFPLALEEWMPPVDAVYRPHVVHHIKVSADPRDPNVGSIRGRSKRYFSEVGA